MDDTRSDSAYACVYFKSDKTVSVIPKSRCILRDAFEMRDEVEVKWRMQGKQQLFIGSILQVSSKQDKHLLDSYTEDLHLYIRNAIKEEVKFTVDDLIERWQPDRGIDFDHSSLTPLGSQNPPLKKRRTEKAIANQSKAHGPGAQKKNKAKGKDLPSKNQQKIMAFSSNLAAQEIIEITQFNNVFPPRPPANKKHFSNQQLQPIPTIQDRQQITAQSIRMQREQHAINEKLYPEVEQRPILPSRASQATSANVHNIQHLTDKPPPSTTATTEFGNVVSVISYADQTRRVEGLPLASTGNVYRTALSTLDEFSDDADSLINSNLDDSGIANESFDSDEETEEDLREKVTKLEKENTELKRQLSASRFAVPPPEVVEYFKKCIQYTDGTDTLLNDGAETRPRDATTSYVVKANFKPVEGQVRLLKEHDVFVPGHKLRQIITEAHLKGPLHLLQKLIPLVFTTEELANSCGQGLNQSKLQLNPVQRKPLDPVKTQVLKDYLLSFCIANDKECPVAKQMNETLTQQVSYARRKQQRVQGKLNKFDIQTTA